MQIYIHRNNQQLGPYTEDEIKAQLASGAISQQDNVWWEGQTNWMPLGQSPLATTLIPAPRLTPSVVPNPLAGTPSAPHLNSNIPKTSQTAIWALVCGCCSILCSLLTSIPAIILGHMALAETKRDPQIQGRGMAIAGTILGYVFTTFIILYFACIMLFLILGKNVSANFKNIEAQIKAAQETNSTDENANSPDQSTNSSDSNTNSPSSQ